MTVGRFPVRASIGVRDIKHAARFYEDVLGLEVDSIGPSADIDSGARFYRAGGGTILNVYETPNAGGVESTVAVFYVDDIDAVADELVGRGAEFVRYDGIGQDARGIGPRAGGGRIGWVKDPEGNTIALESDE